MNVQRKEKGFTIIEVVLVLAIAGLIFLMVFIALPALQRSQRDSARKSEVGTVASAITSYQSNNRGSAPTDVQIGQYITGNNSAVLDSGSTIIVRATVYSAPITLTANLPATANAADNVLYADQIKVYYGYKCDPTASDSLIRGTSRQAAIAVALESGPSVGSVYCQTN
ncbi:prepilin-type N-terminal cleavage/methylation domain-containing protein [Patescibacteria group bacterium]|nr:MAG: prepilin-type N-terminal cleavage/methylation domain-containing protein [Patescibacteria group bacterium]